MEEYNNQSPSDSSIETPDTERMLQTRALKISTIVRDIDEIHNQSFITSGVYQRGVHQFGTGIGSRNFDKISQNLDSIPGNAIPVPLINCKFKEINPSQLIIAQRVVPDDSNSELKK